MKLDIHIGAATVQPGMKIHRSELRPEHFRVIQKMLSKDMYSNPLKACIQEISSNAQDSHVEKGNKEVPINIWLPTPNAPELTIEDHGIGINEHRMLNHFTNIAASTKRDDDTQLGGWGLGSKTGFAVSDTFYVETVADDLDGVRRHRVWCHFKDDGLNSCVMMTEQGTEADTGTKIKIPIEGALDKIDEMVGYVISTMRYWEVLPVIHNAPESFAWPDSTVMVDGDGWWVSKDGEGGVTALVGSIPYQLNKGQLHLIGIDYKGVNSLVLPFATGEVLILPTRESIDYSASAAALIERFSLFKEQIEGKLIKASGDGSLPFRDFIGMAHEFGIDKATYNGNMVSTSFMRNRFRANTIKTQLVSASRDSVTERWEFSTDKMTSFIPGDQDVFHGVYSSAMNSKIEAMLAQRYKHELNAIFILLSGKKQQLRDVIDNNPELAYISTDISSFVVSVRQKPKYVKERLYQTKTGNSQQTQDLLFVDVFDVAKLRGMYAFYKSGKIVDIVGKPIRLDRIHCHSNHSQAPVHLFRHDRWSKGANALLLQSQPHLIYYQDACKKRAARRRLHELSACSALQRTTKCIMYCSSRTEWLMIMSLIKLKPFRNVRKRIRESLTYLEFRQPTFPSGFLKLHMDPHALVKTAYTARFIQPSKSHLKEWPSLLKCLRILPSKTVTMSLLKSNYNDY